jgi:hypothetical protein
MAMAAVHAKAGEAKAAAALANDPKVVAAALANDPKAAAVDSSHRKRTCCFEMYASIERLLVVGPRLHRQHLWLSLPPVL